jgi:3-methylfumaryl-CoA hydratase
MDASPAGVPAGQKTTATVPPGAHRPCLSERTELTNAQLPAMTWNAHRIHYDGDHTRREEGYPPAPQRRPSMHLRSRRARPRLRHHAPRPSAGSAIPSTCGARRRRTASPDLGGRQERACVQMDRSSRNERGFSTACASST